MTNKDKKLLYLRDKIIDLIHRIETWKTIDSICKALNLSVVDKSENIGKKDYIKRIIDNSSDNQIIAAAEQILEKYPGSRERLFEMDSFEIRNALWWIEKEGLQEISNITRIRIIEGLDDTQFWGRLSLHEFFHPDFPFYNLPDIGFDGKLYEGLNSLAFTKLFSKEDSMQIEPTRTNTSELLKKLRFNEWPDQRFCQFIERVVHPEVQQKDQQKHFAMILNGLLKVDGFELNQIDKQGGLPVYKVKKINSGVDGTPKYIIFASSGPKPDIVIEDTVNMDIRVVENLGECLIYDKFPPDGDLTWKMLLEWWGEKNNLDIREKEIRQKFGLRLQKSLQSEPEKKFFNAYFKIFKNKLGDNLPALLPQVYLHYDPRNRNERGIPIFVRQRMDFLILLRNSNRIVIEIDGKQHYSDEVGRASPQKYAEMISEDRRIKLLGYEIFRFGGAEFVDDTKLIENITTFVNGLFLLYGIIENR